MRVLLLIGAPRVIGPNHRVAAELLKLLATSLSVPGPGEGAQTQTRTNFLEQLPPGGLGDRTLPETGTEQLGVLHPNPGRFLARFGAGVCDRVATRPFYRPDSTQDLRSAFSFFRPSLIRLVDGRGGGGGILVSEHLATLGFRLILVFTFVVSVASIIATFLFSRPNLNAVSGS